MKYKVQVNRQFKQFGDIDIVADSGSEAMDAVDKMLKAKDDALIAWGEKCCDEWILETVEDA